MAAGEIKMNSLGSLIGGGLLVAGLLTSAGPTLAAGSDDGFAAFWTQFKAAVGKSDQKAVSDMIKYPVLYQDVRKVAEFPVIWKGAFKPSHRACLAKQKPVKDTSPKGEVSYSAFCDSIIYSFAKDESGWKLTDFGVND
jgi:hypothetical protein